ncbi:hypothetical protein [Rickettsiella endosymbiont of Rhagonycha lignosa]|uniref:hypothetical protein n=1 Tax=Rickettsiella endosymbiont of Rhagonycha lignosa TaxID=3077937 RepID=UPI00313B0BB0
MAPCNISKIKYSLSERDIVNCITCIEEFIKNKKSDKQNLIQALNFLFFYLQDENKIDKDRLGRLFHLIFLYIKKPNESFDLINQFILILNQASFSPYKLYEQDILLNLLDLNWSNLEGKSDANIKNLIYNYQRLFLNYIANFPEKSLTFNNINFYFKKFENLQNQFNSLSNKGIVSIYAQLSKMLDTFYNTHANYSALQNEIFQKISVLQKKDKEEFFLNFLLSKFNGQFERARISCEELSQLCKVKTLQEILPVRETIACSNLLKIEIRSETTFNSEIQKICADTYKKAFQAFNLDINKNKIIKLFIFANKTSFEQYSHLFGFPSNSEGVTIAGNSIAISLQKITNLAHELIHCLVPMNVNKLGPSIRESIPEYIQNLILYQTQNSKKFKAFNFGAIAFDVIHDLEKINESENTFLKTLIEQRTENPENYYQATLLAAYLLENHKLSEILKCAVNNKESMRLCLIDFIQKENEHFIQFITSLKNYKELNSTQPSYPKQTTTEIIPVDNPHIPSHPLAHPPAFFSRLVLGSSSGFAYGLSKAVFDISKEKFIPKEDKAKRLILKISQIFINSAIQSSYGFSFKYPDRIVAFENDDSLISPTGIYFAMGLSLELCMHLLECLANFCDSKILSRLFSYLFILYPVILICFSENKEENELQDKIYTFILSTLANLITSFGLKQIYYRITSSPSRDIQEQHQPLITILISKNVEITEDFLDIKHLIGLLEKRLNLFQNQISHGDLNALKDKINTSHYEARKHLHYIQGKLEKEQGTNSFKILIECIEQRFLLLDSTKNVNLNSASPVKYLSDQFKKILLDNIQCIWEKYEILITYLLEKKNQLSNDFLKQLITVDKGMYDVMLIVHIKDYLEYMELSKIRRILQPVQKNFGSEQPPETIQQRVKLTKGDLEATLKSIDDAFTLLGNRSVELGDKDVRKMIHSLNQKIITFVQTLRCKLQSDSITKNRFSSFFASNKQNTHNYEIPSEPIYANLSPS